ISMADVRQLKEKLKSMPHTANRTMQLLRAVYNRAIKAKAFKGENPVVGIPLYKEKPRGRFLEKVEVERLFKTLNEYPLEDPRDFIWLSLLTGARKSNLFSMQFSDIDFDGGVWLIPETKNGTSQPVALTGLEIKILKTRELKSDSDFVFPGE